MDRELIIDANEKKVWILRKILTSELFKKLSPIAVKIYLVFLLKCQNEKLNIAGKPGKRGKSWRIKNNGEIEFTYSEARKYCTDKTFAKAIDELFEKGLIDITHEGIGAMRDKSKYAISGRWKKFDTPEFEVKKRVKRNWHKKKKKNFPIGKNSSCQ